jgi:hypothetical protein
LLRFRSFMAGRTSLFIFQLTRTMKIKQFARMFPAMALWCVCAWPQLSAQTPSDAIMMANGQFCAALLYTHDTWDEYWEGTLKRDNGNIGVLTRQSVMPMLALGIGERINVIGALPWVRTAASAGQVAGAQGLQDWGLWVKAKVFERGPLSAYGVLGAGAPASRYLPDYAPFNLGLGAPELSLRGIAAYQHSSGLYGRAHWAYHFRGQATIERDYYYTTHGYYTDQVEVPDAVTYGVVAGAWLLNESLKVEAGYDGMISQWGHDIRRQDVGFPSNRMIFTRIGGGLQYHPPRLKGLGFVLSGNYVLAGRNVGQSTTLTGGLLYQFSLWNNHQQ